MKKRWLVVGLVASLAVLAVCLIASFIHSGSVTRLPESPIQEIDLAGPAAKSKAEISGMAWCGEQLVLLPQYPMDYADAEEPGYVFSIPRQSVTAYLSGATAEAILPEMLPLNSRGIESLIPGFEGFEAILFDEGEFYLTIEARQGAGMMGYLVRGEISGDCERLTLTREQPVPIQPQAGLGNMSDETLVMYANQLFTLYEANGMNVNRSPVAHRFELSLEASGTLPLPFIEYRITDATEADEQGAFWALNTFFPGDTKLKPGVDQIAQSFGLGESHLEAAHVERLINLQIEEDKISLRENPPVYLDLTGSVSRNWEGLVRFGEGFLLVTDEHPKTILAYVGLSRAE